MVIEEQTKAALATSNSRAPVTEYDASELEVGGVVVYPDRAEVKRMIRTRLKKGENNILVNQLPSVVDPKSLRLVLRYRCYGFSNNCVIVCQLIRQHIYCSLWFPSLVQLD